jgi:hypothetical protein
VYQNQGGLAGRPPSSRAGKTKKRIEHHQQGGNTMLKYRVVVSKLSNNPTGFAARVTSRRTVELEEIAAEIARLGTTVSEPDVLNVLCHYNDVIARMLLKGEIVNTPAVRYKVSIRGPFANQADSFDPARHQVTVRLSAGPLLRRAMRDAAPEKYKGTVVVPQPQSYIDTFTGAQNSALTPHQEGRLVGNDLRFDPADARQGVFFLDEAGTATRVPAAGLNLPSQLMFIVPELAAGTYRLEVRALFGHDGEEELRVGRLGAVLTVS